MIDKHTLIEMRRNTPGLGTSIHFNHAGASLMSRGTFDAIQDHFALESKIGPMEAGIRVSERIANLRGQLAALLNSKVEEIALMPSASAAFGAVFSSMPKLEHGDRILVGRQEWGGNLSSYVRAANMSGARIEVMPCREDGSVDAVALESRLDAKVKLISLTWLPANGGLINDAAAVGRLARTHRIPYLIDASQAFGHIPIDVQLLSCDVLFAAGRKHIRGPRGTGILYVRESYLDKLNPPFVDISSAPWDEVEPQLRADARRFEGSEKAISLWLGFSNALKEALTLGIDRIAAHEQALATHVRERMSIQPGVEICDLGTGRKSGLISFTVAGIDPAMVKTQLSFAGVQIAVNGVAYTPLDMKSRGLSSIARVGVSYLNTERDIDRLIESIKTLKISV
jgi:cysteine desulfurase/selenocysteine lyase